MKMTPAVVAAVVAVVVEFDSDIVWLKYLRKVLPKYEIYLNVAVRIVYLKLVAFFALI